MTQEKTIEKTEKIVYTDAHPEYPKLLYKHETREMKGAASKEEQEKLAKDGFVEEPLPPVDPISLTPEEVTQLQELLSKAAKALAKLGELSQTHPTPKKEPNKHGVHS